MNTWFTNEPFINNVLDVNLNVIVILKGNKQVYRYKGKPVGLKQIIANRIHFDTTGGIFSSIRVSTKKPRIPVKLVFIRNYNNQLVYIPTCIHPKITLTEHSRYQSAVGQSY